MANRSLKQSQFQIVQAMPTGAYMGLWAAGVNYGIAYSDFLGGLGVTGTIVQAGDVTGVPVLDTQGTVNHIRNIEPGPGIYAEISAQNGLMIRHNIAADTTGTPLLQAASTAPKVVSLVAGDGIDISVAGAAVTIASLRLRAYGDVSMQGNSTATTLSATDTPALVVGTWSGGTASQFTASAGGRLTCNYSVTQVYTVSGSVSLTPTTGSAQGISLYIAKNGSVLPETRMEATVDSGTVVSLSTSALVSLGGTDYVELYIQNETATNSVTVSRAILSVR